MAWRPNPYFLEGELDNTVPGRVTGWMRFAGLSAPVTLDLAGNFHRDIRGAKIRLHGDGDPDNADAADYMQSFAAHQTGRVGDITAGREPRDYVDHPYIEWYGDANGRVVLEVDADRIDVIGQPIPACESDPISREEQQANMARFLSEISSELNVPAILAGPRPMVSDPAFTHWVVDDGQIIGDARSVEPETAGMSFAYVRLFATPDMAEFGTLESSNLRPKDTSPNEEAADDPR